nr:uncharacterized protein LOC128695043 [Cherax quadricarinatus]
MNRSQNRNLVILVRVTALSLVTVFSDTGDVLTGICAEPCDGNLECPDGSDETKELCSSKPCSEGQTGGGIDLGDLLGDAKSSVTGKFRCAYGGCISHNFLCNGHRDCWDQSDETPDQCLSKKCNRRDFRCDYGACIKKLWSCNGYPNCLDGSDETAKACKATTCSSNKFRCKYGACIDMIKKCDGIVHCMDSSDESKELCGAQHTAVTTPGPVILTPVPVTSKPEVPPTPRPPTPRPPTPSPPTPTPSTGKPIIEGCEANKMCSCPPPNEHFCVACGSSPDVCAGIVNEVVCSVDQVDSSDTEITIDVLSCGVQPIVNIAGIVRSPGAPMCGSDRGVPVLSVVLADCWGTTHLAECRPDGLWYPYGNFRNDTLPSKLLCQSNYINSHVCGRRPRYPIERAPRAPEPQWPWLVGIFNLQKFVCTGTIISPYYLLTAAHCLTTTQETTHAIDVRNLRVQHPFTNGSILKDYVTKVHLYPGYIAGNRPSHDVALIRVETEIIYSRRVYPACVLTGSFPQYKDAATFLHTSENYKWILIIQQRDTRCRPTPHRECGKTLKIDDDQFCGISQNSNQFLKEGSSGGPYLVNFGNDVEEKWMIAGIVSSSYSEASCPASFTIFNHIIDFWNWISTCVNDGICL